MEKLFDEFGVKRGLLEIKTEKEYCQESQISLYKKLLRWTETEL